MKPLAVGDTLWLVPNDRRWSKPRAVTVTKVGRVYATVDTGEKVFLDTWQVKTNFGGGSRCYESEATWQAAVAADAAWYKLRTDMGYRVPDGVTTDQIAKARALLGLL